MGNNVKPLSKPLSQQAPKSNKSPPQKENKIRKIYQICLYIELCISHASEQIGLFILFISQY